MIVLVLNLTHCFLDRITYTFSCLTTNKSWILCLIRVKVAIFDMQWFLVHSVCSIYRRFKSNFLITESILLWWRFLRSVFFQVTLCIWLCYSLMVLPVALLYLLVWGFCIFLLVSGVFMLNYGMVWWLIAHLEDSTLTNSVLTLIDGSDLRNVLTGKEVCH
jgi:hypothetical protein